MSYNLDLFINDCKMAAQEHPDFADVVTTLAPKMLRLINDGGDFLKPEHFESDPNKYARNAVFVCPEEGISLFTLVWNPGQWTPVHDHGTWGVVGVIKGVLEERAFIRTDDRTKEDEGILLKRGGMVLLPPGSVTTFVPNPDHIHKTGVPDSREQVVSLHLYGREMNDYYCYNVATGRRSHVQVDHRDTGVTA
ncbi:cysteine dioxygenase family protein [Planctomycetota bacterium]|nr:cysteine dioxygenase family protein [Planctomycetota bacterium]